MLKPLLLGTCMAMLVTGCAAFREHRIGSDTTRAADTHCLQVGSRLNMRGRHCTIGPGRIYTREQIVGSGASSTAGAIAALDPTISVRGN